MIKNLMRMRQLTCLAISQRFKSSFSSNYHVNKVCFTDDGRTIVCWHPEMPFPYECSLPLPEQPKVESNSILKVQATAALKEIYRPKPEELERQELMKLTFTTKHRWFPKARVFKHRKPSMDRPYL